MFFLEPPMKEMIRDFSIVMICLFLGRALMATDSRGVFEYALQAGGIMMLWSAIESMAIPDDFWRM